jgi:hypothetical protein
MNKKIKTYEDLLEHKQKLQTLLDAQKELVKADIQDVKAELGKSAAAVGKIFTRDTSNFLIMAGANRLIDVVVKNTILGRAGWVLRLAIPFLLKNYSSHYIADNKDKWYRKLFSWVGNKNGKAPKRTGQKN